MAYSAHTRHSLRSKIAGWLYIALKGVLLLIVMIGWLAFMINGGTAKNKHADPSMPLAERAPLLLNCALVRTEADHLLAYNRATGSLGVYDENDAFVCSYRIPNIAQGSTTVHTAFGDMYISQDRSHDVYRYGARGEYLGCILYTENYEEFRAPTNNIYDAQGNCTARYSIQTGRILAFTSQKIYWKDDDDFLLQQDAFGELTPAAPIDTQYAAGGYSVKWTTLMNSEGLAVDSSPWYEQFRSSPSSTWLLMVICMAVLAVLKRVATKLEYNGLLTTGPWQQVSVSVKEHLMCVCKRREK